MSANTARGTQPVSYVAALSDMQRVSRHEAAHADYAVHVGWTISRVILRADATGFCEVAGGGTGYDTELHRIVFQLVGLGSDLRESAGWVSQCFDTIAARLKIDALNDRQIGPHVSFEQAAGLAVIYVDGRQQAVHDIGLALWDARELGHFEVELFGRCGAMKRFSLEVGGVSFRAVA